MKLSEMKLLIIDALSMVSSNLSDYDTEGWEKYLQ